MAASCKLARTTFDTAALDAIVGDFMDVFGLPGIALAVAGAQGPGYVKGYGVRKAGEPARVDVETSFAIGSTSKAFLSACLAILVDEGKLAWDDPVRRHLPEFRLHDPVVSDMMTVRDLLLHNSGLPLGAADLMQFPYTDHRPEEVLAALRHFSPGTGFRSGYAYDNCLYIVAGILLERVSGASWEQFASKRLFTPLGMRGAVANPTLVTSSNRAGRHARLGPPVIGMGSLEPIVPSETALIGPAGGINCSAAALLPWLRVQLGRGVLADGGRLWSAAQADDMWTARTLIASGPGPTADAPQRSVLQAYALGWGVSDFRGNRMLAHAGGLAGQTSRVTLLPERQLGLALLSNSGDAEPLSSLRYALLDSLLGVAKYDWIGATRATIDHVEAQVREAAGTGDFLAPRGGPSLALARYAGLYRDAWYGEVMIDFGPDGLGISFTRSPSMRSTLEPFGEDAFRTRFPRGTAEDAILRFHIRDGAIEKLSLRALSPLADFSFDYHHLLLLPVPSNRSGGAP